MKYVSMLDIWNQSFYVSLVKVGAATLLYTFVFVCFRAFVVCIFSDQGPGLFYFQEKINLFTCHECKTKENKKK